MGYHNAYEVLQQQMEQEKGGGEGVPGAGVRVRWVKGRFKRKTEGVVVSPPPPPISLVRRSLAFVLP